MRLADVMRATQCVTLRYMEQVGMRELRHRLREYLGRVEAGTGFEITLFGRAVAELRPLGGTARTMAQLVADGLVTPPLSTDTEHLPAPVMATTGITATAALLTERHGDAR